MKKILLTLIISCVFANLIWATSENTKNGSDKNTIYSYITKAQSTIKEALGKSDLQAIQELAYKAKRFSYSAQCEADECDYDYAEDECENAAFKADRAYRASSIAEAKDHLNKALNHLAKAKNSL